MCVVCSYMIFVTIFSKPQLNAIVQKVKDEAMTRFGREVHMPGGRSAWEVIDMGDIVVQVMSAEMREYYGLEAFYSAAEEVELPFLEEEAELERVWGIRQ
jgi:ribosome-associated protein